TTQAEWMLNAALNLGEWLLAALLVVWGVFVVVQTAALVLGLWLGRGLDRAVRQSLDTSRLGVVGSTALFAVLSLVLWSVVSYVAGNQLKDFNYLPVIFGRGTRLSTAKSRSEEHTSELQSHLNLVCRLLLEKKKQ